METILVQLNSDKAYQLLKDLEDLKVITLLPKNKTTKKKVAKKYDGIISSTLADELQSYVSESRGEWEKRNT